MKVSRDFADGDRYRYDFGLCSVKNGFAQVDTEQDAWYYGTWANPFKLIIFSYCEGDCTLQEADSQEEFTREMLKLKAWNEENGWKFSGIDCMCKDALEQEFIKLGLKDLLH